MLGADGLPDFNALQNAFDHRTAKQITYFVFDLPFLDGHDLRKVPLAERRALLRSCSRPARPTRPFQPDFEADAGAMLESARRWARGHHR